MLQGQCGTVALGSHCTIHDLGKSENFVTPLTMDTDVSTEKSSVYNHVLE